MNKRQKEVLQASLQDEQAVMAGLESNYTSALARIRRNIKELQSNPLTQSKAYQLEFQQQLETQVSGILDTLQGSNFTTIAEYLQTCYQTGFIGTAYDWQGQGVPLTIPINQRQVITAVQKTGDDFKLSTKLGVNTKLLKEQVKTELQRGLASNLSYSDIARNITDYGQADMNRSKLIARTEGHRVQNDARMDAMREAKRRGADIVKQWDATLDGNTRPHHRELDGQVQELDDPFTVAGMEVDAPGGFGIAAEDCNCRCCVLQRARWALQKKVDPDTGEVTYTDKGEYQKWNNENGGLIKTTGFDDFKQKYLKATSKPATMKRTITSAADCTSFAEMTKHLGDTYGLSVDPSVTKLDFSAVQQSITGVEQVMMEFPQAQSTLQGFGTSKSGVMCASFDGEIKFNPSYYAKGNPSVSRVMVQGDTTGFHPRNTGVRETGSHEMGHILERALIERSYPGTDAMSRFHKAEAWSKCTEAKKVISQACKNAKRTPEGKGLVNIQLKSSVSGYATKNDSECLAECVADYVANGENASLLSREVWKILKGLLG